jgi:hypothetical protein
LFRMQKLAEISEAKGESNLSKLRALPSTPRALAV